MSKKTVAFKMPSKLPPANADEWIKSVTGPAAVETATAPDNAVDMAGTSQTLAPAAPSEPMKRFTIDVPEGLHKRIKSQCAMRGVKMADVLREMMEKEFPIN